MSSLQFTINGLCVCLCNKYTSRVFIHKVLKFCLFVFMTQRSLPNAVFKKTIMSFLGCWFGKGLSLNHTVYLFIGRDGILNGIFLKFQFLPKRNANHQRLICSSSDFSVSSHHLFGGLNSAKNVGNFLRFSSHFERKFLWGRRMVLSNSCVS